MLGLEFTPSTVAVLLIVIALAVLSARRMWRNGMCDCHSDDPRGKKHAGGCAGCAGCGAASAMVEHAQRAANEAK